MIIPITLIMPSRSRDGQYLVFQLRYNFLQPNEVAKYILLDLQASTLEGFVFR